MPGVDDRRFGLRGARADERRFVSRGMAAVDAFSRKVVLEKRKPPIFVLAVIAAAECAFLHFPRDAD